MKEKSVDKNGWYYPIASNEELSIKTLKIFKKEGLVLLLTRDQTEKLKSNFKLSGRLKLSNYLVECPIPNSTKTNTIGDRILQRCAPD